MSYYKDELLEAGIKENAHLYIDYYKYGDSWGSLEFEAEFEKTYEDYIMDEDIANWKAADDLNEHAPEYGHGVTSHYFDETSQWGIIILASDHALDDKELRHAHNGESSGMFGGYGTPYSFDVDEFDEHNFQPIDIDKIGDYVDELIKTKPTLNEDKDYQTMSMMEAYSLLNIYSHQLSDNGKISDFNSAYKPIDSLIDHHFADGDVDTNQFIALLEQQKTNDKTDLNQVLKAMINRLNQLIGNPVANDSTADFNNNSAHGFNNDSSLDTTNPYRDEIIQMLENRKSDDAVENAKIQAVIDDLK